MFSIKSRFLIFLLLNSTHMKVYCLTVQDHIARAQIYEKEKNASQAIESYKNALILEPGNLMSRFLLGNIYANQYDFSLAYEQFKIILNYRPTISTVAYNAAYCLRSLGQYEQAIILYDQVLKQEPNHGDAHQGKAHAQLALNNYENAWEDFEYRWSKPRPDSRYFAEYMHNHKSLQGKKILLHSEFGLGDTLQFIRYAQELKKLGAIIIVHAQKPLISLLSLCPYIDQVLSTDQPLPAYDLSSTLMSLPWAFNTTIKTVPSHEPYLFADKILIEQWNKKIKNQTLKIGICWNGNAYDNQVLQKLVQVKSMPLALITQLDNKQITWYSLQKTTGTEQLKDVSNDFKLQTFDDFDESHGRFMDTAALIKNLDLVITIDTSIAHLAGGLGVKTWILLPHVADWRWGTFQDTTPWYPTMKLFRQSNPDNWQSVIDQLKEAIDRLLLTEHNQLSLDQLYQQGVYYTNQGNLALALDYFKHAYHRLPTNSTLAHALASTYRKLNDLDNAASFYKRSLQLNPTSGDSSFGLSLTLLAQGNNEEGWKLFNRWRSEEVLKKCPENLEDVAGKTVVILAEWGLGDMIHFIRFAQNLKKSGAKVIVQSHACLGVLLKSCDFIDEIIPAPQLPTHADYYIPLLYLPTLCKTNHETIAQIPYITAPELKQVWHTNIKQNHSFKIGICWDIGHHDTNIAAWKRSAPLANWLDLTTLPGVSFYSLQKDGAKEIKQLISEIPIIDFGPEFDAGNNTFLDTAALIKHMDLIITVDTAVAHLAGALGVATWILLPYSPDYRWGLQGDSTIWYPGMRLFRQKNPGDWKSVFEEVKRALGTKIKL